MLPKLLSSLALLFGCCSPGRAWAQDPLQGYALLVGSNQGGPGQHPLAYAEDDAERVGALLVELGRIPAEHVRLLAAPSADALRAALAELKSKIAAHGARGERTELVFYYSGHARAHALSLGAEDLPIAELRASLTALSSTLTVVVLDACQSGAFSGVKGAHAAEDFSQVSVSSLRSEGLAVMASSSGTELSQESHELGAGYFTHHLLVGLRGAGDVDGDARVSLDEAYRYAYTQTLSSTARTRVGMQHATLETALSGRGDVPLTYTADADAQLVLPRDTSGRVLVQLPGRGSVIAELVKAEGSELTLALPDGRYDVLLRVEGSRRALSCHVLLPSGQRTPLVQAGCQSVLLDDETHKKDGQRELRETWFSELGLSYSQRPDDPYIDTLARFGFSPTIRWNWLGGPWDGVRGLHANVAAGYGLHRMFALLVRYDGLERRAFDRFRDDEAWAFEEDSFKFKARAFSLGARVRYPTWHDFLVPYLELDVGLGMSRSRLRRAEGDFDELQLAPTLRSAAGVTLGRGLMGAYLAGGFVYAPITRNDFGERHNDGGAFLELGIRFSGHGRR